MKVANNAGEFQNNLKSRANEMAESVNKQLAIMTNEYWEAITELQEMKDDGDFSSKWEYLPLVKKVSQLGLALEQMGKAYSAINTVRCI